MRTRRQLLRTGGLTAAAAVSQGLVHGGSPRANGTAPFRLLYSNDLTHLTSCVSPYRKSGEPFRPEHLEASVDEVAPYGVDVHLLQPGLGMVPLWPSQVLPLEAHYAWIKERYGQGPDPFGLAALQGIDLVQRFIDRCRSHGQRPFLSFRLNDAHHKEHADPKPGVKPGSSIGMSVTRFYAEHPEYRIKLGSSRAADVVWNWAIPEVRATKFALIQEACERYDLDGIELDFLRFYNFFRIEETPLPERCAIITGFVREVRALLDRTARDGRRRWLSLRIPCFLPSLDWLGLHLSDLSAAGVDLFNASAHYFTTQQHDLGAIRKQIPGRPLYFELSHSTWNGPKMKQGYDVFPFRRATPEQLRTSAHLAYSRGADGISLFNFPYYREHGAPGRGPFGQPPFSVLPQLSDPAALASFPQHWFLAPGWRAPGTKPSLLPYELRPDRPASFPLDLAPPSEGWKREARLRVQAASEIGARTWQSHLNETPLEPIEDRSEPFSNPYPSLLGKPEEIQAWRVPAQLLREGVNHLSLQISSESPLSIVFIDLIP